MAHMKMPSAAARVRAPSHGSMDTDVVDGRTTQNHTQCTQVAEAKSFSVGSPEARAAGAAVEEIEGALRKIDQWMDQGKAPAG